MNVNMLVVSMKLFDNGNCADLKNISISGREPMQ